MDLESLTVPPVGRVVRAESQQEPVRVLDAAGQVVVAGQS